MKPLHNWKEVLKRAWSIRLMVIAAVLTGAEAALPLLDGYVSVPQGVFALAVLIVTVAAFIARLIAQDNLSGD